MAWLGTVTKADGVVTSAQRAEIATFCPGGLDKLFRLERETQHAPWPGDFVFRALEDTMQSTNKEKQIKATQT